MPFNLHIADLILFVIVLLFAFGGYQKGFAAQVAHVLTFGIFGVTLFFGYPVIFRYFGRMFRDLHETYLTWLLIAVLVVAAIGLFILLNKLLAGLLKTQMSERSDRVNGFILGFVRGGLTLLVCSVLLIVLGTQEIYSTFSQNSKAGEWVCREIIPIVQPHMNRAVFGEKVDAVRNRLLQREDPMDQAL